MATEDTAAARATVTCGSFRATLAPGETLTFGRGRGHALRIGHAPEDLAVPRFAGRLECRDDGLLVHNMSDKRSLTVRTFPGPGYEVRPLMIAGTHPHPQVKIVVTGHATEYAILVDSRALRPVAGGGRAPADPREGRTTGFERIETLSPRHRLLLTVLCLPGLTRTGARARPPTYAEMELLLRTYGYAVRAKTVRNDLLDLRTRLANEHGVDGLLGNEPGGQGDNFLVRLEEWAVRSGNVTDEDLDRLEVESPGRPEGEPG